MMMRSHSNGGYVNALDECWKMCEKFNANIVIMYDHVSCKNFGGLHGLFEDQARERGIHLIWVQHDLMDPRTVSRKAMRDAVNKYMLTVFREEPLDPTYLDYSDELTGKEGKKMKYFGGCDVGSTYTKTVILDENGAIVAANTIKSKINSAQSAKAGLDQAIADAGLKEISDLTYLIGTGYGRNKVPQADENISEISCHAMGVHVTDPSVRAIIDIGGQDVKGIAVDTDGTVKTFAMNDKCAAGTGRFFESMANAFEMSLEEFSKLSLTAENVIPITAQCTVFAESEVITLVGEGNRRMKLRQEFSRQLQNAVL